MIWREFSAGPAAAIPEGFREVDSRIAERERTAEGRARLSAARQRLSARLEGKISTLAQLRMARGWSQKRLAEEIGTSQPHIARIETGRDNVLLDTAQRLARALGVSLEEIARLLDRKA